MRQIDKTRTRKNIHIYIHTYTYAYIPKAHLPIRVKVGIEPHFPPASRQEPDPWRVVRVVVGAVQHKVVEPLGSGGRSSRGAAQRRRQAQAWTEVEEGGGGGGAVSGRRDEYTGIKRRRAQTAAAAAARLMLDKMHKNLNRVARVSHRRTQRTNAQCRQQRAPPRTSIGRLGRAVLLLPGYF